MALEDKTEAPTPRRRTEARDEGQVAKSSEVNAAAVLITGLLVLKMTGSRLGTSLTDTMTRSLSTFPTHDIAISDVSTNLVRLLLVIGSAIAPFILAVMLAGVVANVAQVGLHISPKTFQIKGGRMNPLKGIVGMFSMRALVELVKSTAKILVISFIIYTFLMSKASEIIAMVGGSYKTTCATIGSLTYGLLMRTAFALLVIAALDYAYQRYNNEKQLKMSKQEVKDDSKRTEGDPLIKGKIRQKQREVSQRRMMAEVPKADVVVSNPTHFAVALKYDSDISAAPMVVAKGMDYLAQRIKAIAIENNVPLVENVALARALYATVEIGDEIPADLYQAVAEILAYVYKLSKRFGGRRA
ncbi:MAG: flagellar biosynthesis protein FlhB [Armatimonadetes bacterium]|nr:flagellar biosynthesis protein FlhB [Armatimonadota bacterium]